jgi:hypothetical protein
MCDFTIYRLNLSKSLHGVEKIFMRCYNNSTVCTLLNLYKLLKPINDGSTPVQCNYCLENWKIFGVCAIHEAPKRLITLI